MLRGLAHLVAEGNVYGVVRQFERLPRISLLVPARGQGRHGAGSRQGLLIDDRRLTGARGRGIRLRRLPGQNQPDSRRQHQGQKPQRHDPLMSFHPHIGLLLRPEGIIRAGAPYSESTQ